MSLLPLTEFFSSPGGGGGIVLADAPPSPEVSISAGREYTGAAMPNLRILLNAAHWHNSLEEAVNNIGPTGYALAGHGTPGAFDAGDGQVIYQTETGTVHRGNRSYWEGLFAKLRIPHFEGADGSGDIHRIPKPLYIWSCSVGRGREGAELMTAISDISNRTVHASNGLIYVGATRYYFEKGCRFVARLPPGDNWGSRRHPARNGKGAYVDVATGYHPVPAPLPDRLCRKVGMAQAGVGAGMELEDLLGVTVSTPGRPPAVREMTSAAAEALHDQVFYSLPFRKAGAVAAARSETLIFHFRGREDVVVDVYAGQLAEIRDNPASFMVSPTLANNATGTLG